MNPSETSQSIIVDYSFSQPPQKVWRALTEPRLLSAWLMENDIQPVVGHRFTFRAQPMPGWDGIVHCEVLAVETHKLLRYAWRGGSDELKGYGGKLDTVVTWTLSEASGGGTHLRLEHAGFLPANAFAYENMGKGWRGKLVERIEQLLATL
jgi:uncharacterized protein YndB with AHSA1/START domain